MSQQAGLVFIPLSEQEDVACIGIAPIMHHFGNEAGFVIEDGGIKWHIAHQLGVILANPQQRLYPAPFLRVELAQQLVKAHTVLRADPVVFALLARGKIHQLALNGCALQAKVLREGVL